jgi:hypothetical protein
VWFVVSQEVKSQADIPCWGCQGRAARLLTVSAVLATCARTSYLSTVERKMGGAPKQVRTAAPASGGISARLTHGLPCPKSRGSSRLSKHYRSSNT